MGDAILDVGALCISSFGPVAIRYIGVHKAVHEGIRRAETPEELRRLYQRSPTD